MERDEGRVLTDEILIEIEREIRRIYAAAGVELMQTIDEHFAKFADKDKAMLQLLEQGKITAEQYKQWRLAYIGRGQRMEELRDKLAERVTRANETAIAYINDKTPTIYTLNRNFAAYQVEKASGKYKSFTLFDEATIRRLIMEHPDLMPYYPEKRAVARGIDLAYGKKQILAAITSGILQGKNTRKIAVDLRKRLVDMSVDSALRTARTAVTAAENGGREASYEQAAAMGIEMMREWVATRDARTRREHGHADGQRVGVNEPFTVGGEKLMFPGDKSHGASGWNLYNCRCTIKAMIKGHERTRETYYEWQRRKQDEAMEAFATDQEVLNFLGADARDNLQTIVKRGTVKLENGFAAFPDNDVLGEYVKSVKPLKTYYDVALHGTPTAVGFGTTETNMSPRLLASIIRHSAGWNGQKVRLLSCSTGKQVDGAYCFAEELANALGVTVKAPNDLLYIGKNGSLGVGEYGQGKFVDYKPNQRGRTK